MSSTRFVAFLAVLTIANAHLARTCWRARAELSVRSRLLALYWTGVAIWYWFPAPIFYLLTMNLDQLQLKWTALAFFWEVPVVGGAFCSLALWMFRPISSALDSNERNFSAVGIYRATLRYPLLIAGTIM